MSLKIKHVCVIGLGTVGYPTAEYIAQRGFDVIGYDIINKPSKTFIVTDDWDKIPEDVDVYVITVPTLWDKKVLIFRPCMMHTQRYLDPIKMPL
jgi:phosphoglycerate dehydrogenase-like enzyme